MKKIICLFQKKGGALYVMRALKKQGFKVRVDAYIVMGSGKNKKEGYPLIEEE